MFSPSRSAKAFDLLSAIVHVQFFLLSIAPLEIEYLLETKPIKSQLLTILIDQFICDHVKLTLNLFGKHHHSFKLNKSTTTKNTMKKHTHRNDVI